MDFEIKIENKLEEIKQAKLLPLESYDHIIISASAGKDSMACLFKLLYLGVPKEKIELWHQSVDGGREHYTELMDWPVTESYLEAVGEHYGIKTAFQWRSNGIYGELLRKESLTGDVYYCENGKTVHLPTRNGKSTTRLKWPAMSPDLRVSWCSPYVNIDVFRRVLNNHPRFQGTADDPKKVLVVTGERREESTNRARYLECEVHSCSTTKRIVHAESKSSPFKLMGIVTALVFGLLTALVVINNSNSKTDTASTYEKKPPVEGQPTLGKSDASVQVVEFGDFKCPACKAWGENIYPQLVKDYVDKGKVTFTFINVLFHGEESELGSLAAESVYKQNPDKYWEFHKALFKEQPRENHDALWITDEKINEIAGTIPGLDVNQLQEDMKNEAVIEEVSKYQKLVEEYKVQLTPSIMVNGTMLEDPFDYEKIKSLIDKELEGKE